MNRNDADVDELVDALQVTASMLAAIAKTYGVTREHWFTRDDGPSHEPIFLGEALESVDALIAKHKAK